MGTQLIDDMAADEPAIRFCINAFTSVDGIDEYAPPDETDKSLRWSVYARTPDGDTPVGVDLPEEGDYGTYAQARGAAERGCDRLGLNPGQIRLY